MHFKKRDWEKDEVHETIPFSINLIRDVVLTALKKQEFLSFEFLCVRTVDPTKTSGNFCISASTNKS